MVEHPQVRRLPVVDVDLRRVVAEQDHFHALEPEHPVGLRPAAVVADAHPEHPAEGFPDRKAEVADLEVALLEMLERRFRQVLGVSGKVDLPVLPDDLAAVDEDRGVEVAMAVPVPDQLRVAEVEPDTEPPGGVEEGPGLRSGHRGLEVRVRGRRVLEEVAGEEGGEGELREDHQPAAGARRPLHQVEQPADDFGSRLVGLDTADLGGGDPQVAHRGILGGGTGVNA